MSRWVFSLLLLGLISCKKDGPISDPSLVEVKSGQKILVGNEGNFQFGNGSISLFQKSDSLVTQRLFKEINNRDLGDVCQSLSEMDEKIFIVVNNSGKVEVIKKSDFKVLGTIAGMSSPRYILPVSRRKAYVTDYQANGIYVLDLDAHIIKGFVPIASWTEGIIQVDGAVYVCGKTSDYLYKIDASTNTLADSLQIGAGPTTAVLDRNNDLWILCERNYGDDRPSSLCKVNLSSWTVQVNLSFEQNEAPSDLVINATGDTLYYLNKGVRKMGISQSSLPALSFIQNNGEAFYALGIDYDDNTLYVSDAKDYISNSSIRHYTTSGRFLNDFTAGINAGSFLFLH